MGRLQMAAATIMGAIAIADAASAQAATPLNDREVLGAWELAITPVEREDLDINVEVEEGDLPLTITSSGRGRIACVLRSAPAPCRIDRGRLVISMPTRSGGARMTFTFAERTRTGFSGAARFSVRFLPIGGHIGTVTMTRP